MAFATEGHALLPALRVGRPTSRNNSKYAQKVCKHRGIYSASTPRGAHDRFPMGSQSNECQIRRETNVTGSLESVPGTASRVVCPVLQRERLRAGRRARQNNVRHLHGPRLASIRRPAKIVGRSSPSRLRGEDAPDDAGDRYDAL